MEQLLCHVVVGVGVFEDEGERVVFEQANLVCVRERESMHMCVCVCECVCVCVFLCIQGVVFEQAYLVGPELAPGTLCFLA